MPRTRASIPRAGSRTAWPAAARHQAESRAPRQRTPPLPGTLHPPNQTAPALPSLPCCERGPLVLAAPSRRLRRGPGAQRAPRARCEQTAPGQQARAHVQDKPSRAPCGPRNALLCVCVCVESARFLPFARAWPGQRSLAAVKTSAVYSPRQARRGARPWTGSVDGGPDKRHGGGLRVATWFARGRCGSALPRAQLLPRWPVVGVGGVDGCTWALGVGNGRLPACTLGGERDAAAGRPGRCVAWELPCCASLCGPGRPQPAAATCDTWRNTPTAVRARHCTWGGARGRLGSCRRWADAGRRVLGPVLLPPALAAWAPASVRVNGRMSRRAGVAGLRDGEGAARGDLRRIARLRAPSQLHAQHQSEGRRHRVCARNMRRHTTVGVGSCRVASLEPRPSCA